MAGLSTTSKVIDESPASFLTMISNAIAKIQNASRALGIVVGYNEAVKLLKATITSKHVLNEVFGKVPGEGTTKSTTMKHW